MIWNAHKKEKAFSVFWFFGFPRDLEVHWARLQTTTTTTTDPTTTDPTDPTTEDGTDDGTDDMAATTTYPAGATVSGTTSSGERFSGEIFAYDDANGVLAVRSAGEISNSHDVTLVNERDARDIEVDASTAKDLGPLPEVDDPRRGRRFENATRAAKNMADNIGENVSALAQDVFDALARTLPCKWNGDVIVVMDEVEVRGPKYDEASGSGATHGAAERVQKVLALERAKLGV